MNSYDKNDIAQIAKQTNFIRDNLEKVLRLADVLQFIADNTKLKDSLVLKGGTAINLTVFAMPRKEYDLEPIRQISFPQIRASLLPMLKKGDSFDFEIAKTEVVSFLQTLLQLTGSEAAFIDAFNTKRYQPELLFDDEVILNNICNHPMAYWKIRKNYL